jgi:hypothetical protein
MKTTIYKIQLFAALLCLASCSQFGSFAPKSVDLPYKKNEMKLENGLFAIAPEGYCIGPSVNNSGTGNVIYTACQMTKGHGIVSISFAPLEASETGDITRSYLANNQKIIKTYHLSGYDLIKVDNSSFSNKSVNSTVWRAAKVEDGYMVLGQYFSTNEKNLSDIHQMEVLSASVNNFSPPSNLLSSQLSDVSPSNQNKKAKILVPPKKRPLKSILKSSKVKIRPKMKIRPKIRP